MKDYFKFKLSISTEKFTHKPESSEISKIKYNVVELDCKEIIYLIKKGYAFTHVFTDNTTFTQKEKTINNFKYTHFVAVDVDNSVVDMNQYISSIKFTPTFAYTTFSNCKEGKGYRFRLVYVVNNKITSKERYTDVYRHFTDKLNLEDNCMQSVAQQCFGTTQDADTFISNKVYDLDSIESYKVDVNSTNGHSNFIKKKKETLYS